MHTQSDIKRWLALVEGRDAPLYHGTRLASMLHELLIDQLGRDDWNPRISLTRSYQVAHYFAQSDSPFSHFGGIFVLDQRKLAQRYLIRPYHDRWAGLDNENSGWRDEQEEQVVAKTIQPLSRYLISINADPDILREAYRETYYFRDDPEIQEYFGGRIRLAKQCIKNLLVHPLLNKWKPLVSRPIDPPAWSEEDENEDEVFFRF